MTSLAIVGAIFLVIAYLLYVSKDIITKPLGSDKVNQGITKYVNPRNLGVFMFLLSSWILLAALAIIVVMSAGESYLGIVQTIFYIMLLFVGVFNVAYFYLYATFLIKERLESLNRR
jgi:hypothetical protein